MNLIGIDGCRAGWVCAASDSNLSSVAFSILNDLTETVSNAGRERNIVVIDVPIGLPSRESRKCDDAARRYLPGNRKSSVFPAPCRDTLAATTFKDACERNRRACGKGVSKQLFGILRKICEADKLMTAELQQWVREAHPEVTFAALAGPGSGALPRKSKEIGQIRRIELLGRFIRDVDLPRIRAQRQRLGARDVDVDDLIDAVACLITAYRLSNSQAVVLPEGETQVDDRGLRAEIVA
jgi:predicted RNase H-like nuclease